MTKSGRCRRGSAWMWTRSFQDAEAGCLNCTAYCLVPCMTASVCRSGCVKTMLCSGSRDAVEIRKYRSLDCHFVQISRHNGSTFMSRRWRINGSADNKETHVSHTKRPAVFFNQAFLNLKNYMNKLDSAQSVECRFPTVSCSKMGGGWESLEK